ncbi:MAG TPA: SDR family oxidoreductase [Candidatus Elarobacter sp.]|nr:SDR family oxidoreductase [Candidatus Elarobacter sp.]
MNVATARVLVTGGTSGIGRATALALAQRGARVAICGRHEQTVREAAAEVGAAPFVADVSREADVVALIPGVVSALGGYDALVNNAGFGRFAPLVETTADDMRAVWETNVLGAMLVARESAKHFIAQSYGNIVNVASTAGSHGMANGTAYSSSKFALTSLTECWRAELRMHNIRVMQINPSSVLTEFAYRARGERHGDDPSKLRGVDIAEAIVGMLAQDDRAMVTELTVWATNPR